MRLLKARHGDERLIHDESAEWPERSSALSRLAADGRLDLEPVARRWVNGDDPDLAIEALNKLLTYWSDSPHVPEYVRLAIRWLAADDPDKRSSTASCLGRFLKREARHGQEIVPALLDRLERDDDAIVQASCYEALLDQVAPEKAIEFLRRGSHDFDRATDVRWDLLGPLRERYGKH